MAFRLAPKASTNAARKGSGDPNSRILPCTLDFISTLAAAVLPTAISTALEVTGNGASWAQTAAVMLRQHTEKIVLNKRVMQYLGGN
jgi:hypothetical protein